MERGIREGATAVMEMDNTAQDQSAFTEITLEAILSRENLTLALKGVEANKGAPGVDGMTTEELRKYIFEHPGELTSAILSGKYRPAPVKRVTIPKPEKGKFRNLGIPTVIDRLVQQAVAQKLSYSYDGTFSMSSFGFRPTRSAHDAIFKVMSEADQGYVWAVDMDLEKFFDTVNHSRLIRKLSTRIKDGRVISLITRMLKSGVWTQGKVEKSEVGLMQGGPLSPLLANIYLDELDKELEKRGHRFARYADDLVILCKSKRSAQRTLKSVTRFIEGRMKLKINETKTTDSHITRGVKFLGHGFYKTKDGYFPTVHPKSKERLKNALREILSRNRKQSIPVVKEMLNKKLRGWCEYFKFAKYEKWSKATDEWIRRRIRQLLWKTWKLVRTKYAALRKLGCTHERAVQWANTRKSYWHIANSYILATTLNNDFLKTQGWSWLGLTRVDGYGG
jgi:RNA-directed DNA polymerase